MNTQRTALFGGTFDPPHVGHLAVAAAAAREFSLARVLLAPAGQQPLKHTGPVASFADRLEMVRLLCEGEQALEASGIDGPRADGQPNFTIDTIQRLQEQVGAGCALFVIVGADSFLDLRRWRGPERLLASANWIVVSRPGAALDGIDAIAVTPEQRARVHVLDTVHVPVSATAIRKRLREGLDCSDMVPAPVLKYIHERHLYGS